VSEPFIRTASGIAVDLPRPLRRWLIEQAAAAADDAVSANGPVKRRLFGPIDLAADHDDPVAELQRQFAVEGSLGVLVETAQATKLSEEQAEEWIRGLQLVLVAAAARQAIVTDDDLARIDEQRGAELQTIQALISLLIDALDP